MRKTFFCIDAHTCGNPVRLVAGGGPLLEGATMREKRLYFLEHYDWIRKGLMFEPRGHDMMSGSILYAPSSKDYDIGVLFIETSGCLPMCGHGTIGTVTAALEAGLVTPATPGTLRLETPAGLVVASYQEVAGKVKSVKLINVPSFLVAKDLVAEHPELGTLTYDVAFGGNFYAIIDPQKNFSGMQNYTALDIVRWSRQMRQEVAKTDHFVHPVDTAIHGVHHVMWTGTPLDPKSNARNAVFYGEKAIDRSPCGTGTSARMAQLYGRGKLKAGERFIHESIIGSTFTGTIEGTTQIGDFQAIIPGIEGWARVFGHNTITIDTEDDPLALGFSVI
jgi:4-hydroxyproline epimerase